MNTRQGAMGGLVVAVVASVSVGNAGESFWPAFLEALAFSVLCVGLVVAGLAWAARRQPPV